MLLKEIIADLTEIQTQLMNIKPWVNDGQSIW
jgi:hypothetical protein